MIFGLNNQCHNKTLNIKTDYEKYEICDVIITLMMSCVGDVSEQLCKQCIGCLHFSEHKMRYI